MIEVRALTSFSHDGELIRRGQTVHFSDYITQQLAKKGMVVVLGNGPTPVNPSTADGEKSSASPAAQASPQTTATESDSGETSPAETVPEAEQPEAPPTTEQPAAPEVEQHAQPPMPEAAERPASPAADKAPKPGKRRGGHAAAAQ